MPATAAGRMLGTFDLKVAAGHGDGLAPGDATDDHCRAEPITLPPAGPPCDPPCGAGTRAARPIRDRGATWRRRPASWRPASAAAPADRESVVAARRVADIRSGCRGC